MRCQDEETSDACYQAFQSVHIVHVNVSFI